MTLRNVRTRTLLPAALAACALAGNGASQTSTPWRNIGLYGGGVRSIAASPSTGDVVLAGLSAGSSLPGRSPIYRSADGGSTWTPLSGFPPLDVRDLEFATDDIVFAGTTSGLFKSVDRGQTWTLLPAVAGSPSDYVTDLLVHPTVPGLMWMGTFASSSIVWRSNDYGVSWTALGSPSGFPSVSSIAVDPNNAAHLGLVVFDGIVNGCRVFTSTNGGNTWINRSAGLPNPSVGAVDIEHDGSRWLLVGGALAGSGEEEFGLFESLDDGATWNELSDGSWPTRVLSDLEIDHSDPNRLYVSSARGIFRSEDGGTTWFLPTSGTAQLFVTQLAAVRGANPVQAALSVVGVLKSVNGTNFFPSANGIAELRPTGVDVNPLDPNEIAVSVHNHPGGAILTSLDAGSNWTREAVEPAGWRRVGFDGSGRLHGLSNGFLFEDDDGLYRRMPNGAWTRIGPDQPTSTAQYDCLAFGEAGSGLIFIGGTENVTQPRLWRSLDDGVTWSKSTSFPGGTSVADILVLPGHPNPALIAALRTVSSSATSSGVYRSATLGATWAGTSGLGQFGHFTGLAHTPFARNRVYVTRDGFGSPGTLHRSEDRGRNWTQESAFGNFSGVLADPLREERLFLAPSTYTQSSTFSPMRISNDGGSSTTTFDEGLPPGIGRTRELALGGGPCQRLYLAAEAGVFVRDEVSCHLEASADTFSMSGDSLDFDLAAGAGSANVGYQILGSMSGSSPGVNLFGVPVPLNFDNYLVTTLTMPNLTEFTGFLATTDADGRASANITVSPPGYPTLAGSKLTHAFVTFAFGPLRIFLASNPVTFDALP